MRPLLSSLLVLTAATLHAEEARWVSLDGQPVPAPKSYYNAAWESEVVGPGESPCLQLLPAAKRPAKGTVLIAPGGGYETLSTTKEGSNLAAPLNEAGWDAAVLVYTVGRKEDKDQVKQKALDEAEKALLLIQKRGAELGLSTTQVGAMGFSAGGHLVMRLAHETALTTPPNFLVVMYPGYLAKDGQLQPDVTPPKVPIFLCVGDQDRLLPEAVALDKYCREHEIRCDYHLALGVGHGFGLTKNPPDGAKDWPAKLGTFLASLPEPKAEGPQTPATPEPAR